MMSTLYVSQAQPNPRGKDVTRYGFATDQQLNEEWVEFEARGGDRQLSGDIITHLTFGASCQVSGSDQLVKFGTETLRLGQRLRLHTGRGINAWVGSTLHVYLGRSWYVWNNACGDRVTVRYNDQVVDTAGYSPNPPEGVLVRVEGTDRLVPSMQLSFR